MNASMNIACKNVSEKCVATTTMALMEDKIKAYATTKNTIHIYSLFVGTIQYFKYNAMSKNVESVEKLMPEKIQH